MAKLTLAEMNAKVAEEAHNSNLQNLAHGLRYLAENEREAEKAYTKFKEEAAKLKTEIEKLAEGEVGDCDYNAMKNAYEKTRTISLTFTAGSKW